MGPGRQAVDAEYLHEGKMAALLVNIQYNYPMRRMFLRAGHYPPMGKGGLCGQGRLHVAKGCQYRRSNTSNEHRKQCDERISTVAELRLIYS